MKIYLLNKWYIWICLTFILGLTYFFIISLVFAFNPTEIRIYANDEMVATSKNVFQIQRDVNFNDCINICSKKEIMNNMLYCLDTCDLYYAQNSTKWINEHWNDWLKTNRG